MDLNLIKKLVRIVDTSEITDLEVEENGLRVKIAKKIRQHIHHQHNSPYSSVATLPPAQPVVSAVSEETSEPAESTNMHIIKSPIVGTFYRAPSPDAEPYVKVGDIVSPGSVLCIVEAMKLMNEIESDISGKIVKILSEDTKPVEYNQPLFLIQTG
jgi:acetyl-CoA carboxylase biotin carboxyl carrier protein